MAVQISGIREFAADLLAAVGQEMYDMEEVVRLCTVALYTGGHVLLEGNPGMGKTELVKTLAQVLRLPTGRIQFTPDLMPSDITGTEIPDFDGQQLGRLVFRRGPIFTSLLLADEINRATPKTQSALLEAMAERQVTILGERYRLDVDPEGRPGLPFMVLATQNPIDHEGTYELPEAQTDRFMFKVILAPPRGSTLHRIMEKQAASRTGQANGAGPGPRRLPTNEAASIGLYTQLREDIKRVAPLADLATHIANLVLASNRQFDELSRLSSRQRDELESLTSYFRFGLGPRAAIMLMLAAKAWSLFWGEATIGTADGGDLAHILAPTLRHRIQLKFDWERDFALARRLDPEADVDWEAGFLRDFCLATAPDERAYRRRLEVELPKGWGAR